MSQLAIKQVSAGSEDLARLIAELDVYLLTLYPKEEIFGIDFDSPETRRMIFVVAYLEDEAVGCGGIRPLDDEAAELKRFYVKPKMRRSGVAGQILRCLELRAMELGHRVLRLETGGPQVESVHFYKKNGFHEIDRYGDYVDCESSLCMEKQLGAMR